MKLFISLGVAFITVGLLVYSSWHTLKLHIGTRTVNRETLQQEFSNGAKPIFSDLSKGWIAPLKQEMTAICRPLGLRGMDYFTFGGPKHFFARYVERSNPFSRFDQAWFGVYIIKASKERFGLDGDGIEAVARLAESDQRAWLEAMGDPDPVATWTKLGLREEILIDGHEVSLWEGTIVSHSDLTDAPVSRFASLLGMPPQSNWEGVVTLYHEITLKGIYGAWYLEERGVAVVLYGCASVFDTVGGETYDYYELMKPELLRLALGVKIVPV